MKKRHSIIVLLLVLALVFSACGTGGAAIITLQVQGGMPDVASADRGPHFAAPLTVESDVLAQSGFLELILDERSMTANIRGFAEAEWFTLPQVSATPRANMGAAAVTLDLIVNGRAVTLNTQDHAVYWGNVTTEEIPGGVQVNYLLTLNAETAARADELTENDVAFVVMLRYTLQNGMFFVEADWANASGNPNAFIQHLSLMDRFGILRNPGADDFLLLPDGGGALLFPARATHENDFADSADLYFSVFGEDLASPIARQHDEARINVDHRGNVLAANVGVFGARQGAQAFAAVIERGAAAATIIARQNIPGEANVRQSSVGTRFTITPTLVSGNTVYRAANSLGGQGSETFPMRISYRFFFGATAQFSDMATAMRNQLINAGILPSIIRTVPNPTWPLPLNLTILGTQPQGRGRQTLTTFEQALDMLTRLQARGVSNVNVRYVGALTGNPQRMRPLWRLGGRDDLATLQAYCLATNFSLFLDARMLPGSGAVDLAGNSLPLRNADGMTQSVRGIINRLNNLNVNISLGDGAAMLAADHANGYTRNDVAAHLTDILPSLAAQGAQVMVDTGFFYAASAANVVVNLPMTPQLRTSPRRELSPRYQSVPLLAMLLGNSVDYSFPSINLQNNEEEHFLRSVAFGGAPAFTWAANGHERYRFDEQIELAVEAHTRANAVLGDLRQHSMVYYAFDSESQVSTTRFSNGAVIYVNFSNRDVAMHEFMIPARDFIRR
ncbi:MAG: DUF5696 domain-containing protein [Oscillospiraceae bacterium]|nr:DUF5696 domain-containing protein [Oscillospiraceae bacterium]